MVDGSMMGVVCFAVNPGSADGWEGEEALRVLIQINRGSVSRIACWRKGCRTFFEVKTTSSFVTFGCHYLNCN